MTEQQKNLILQAIEAVEKEIADRACNLIVKDQAKGEVGGV